MVLSELWGNIRYNKDRINGFHKVLCGDKQTLTAEMITKKSAFTKQQLAEVFVGLLQDLKKSTGLLEKAAKILEDEQSKNSKSSDTIIQLQADLIELINLQLLY